MSEIYTNFYSRQTMQDITPMRGMSAYPRSVQCMLNKNVPTHTNPNEI
jgi:hypothetical protein